MNSNSIALLFAIAGGLALLGVGQCHPDTVKVGQYRILSLDDGLYLNAGPPHSVRVQTPNRWSETLRLELGDVTTEKWANFREQRWDLIPAPPESEGHREQGSPPNGHARAPSYWLLSQDNLLNRVSAIKTAAGPGAGDRTKPNVFTLIPVRAPDAEAVLLRSVLRDACLVNPGYGFPAAPPVHRAIVVYAVCNPAARNQQWVLDYLGK